MAGSDKRSLRFPQEEISQLLESGDVVGTRLALKQKEAPWWKAWLLWTQWQSYHCLHWGLPLTSNAKFQRERENGAINGLGVNKKSSVEGLWKQRRPNSSLMRAVRNPVEETEEGKEYLLQLFEKEK